MMRLLPNTPDSFELAMVPDIRRAFPTLRLVQLSDRSRCRVVGDRVIPRHAIPIGALSLVRPILLKMTTMPIFAAITFLT